MNEPPSAEKDAPISEGVARQIMLRLGQEIADTQDYQAACRVIREFSSRAAPPGAFVESCLPSGCSCGCHNPTSGIQLHYSHLVPCCDQPATRSTSPEGIRP